MARILRLMPRGSTFRPRKGWQYERLPQNHSAWVKHRWPADWTGRLGLIGIGEGDESCTAVPLEGVFPLALVRQDVEPRCDLVVGGQLAVVFEDDGWRISGFEGDYLIGAFDDGDAVGDE